MSETQFERLDRKGRILQERIDAEKKAARPLTEAEFEKNEHLKSGQRVPATRLGGVDSWPLFHRYLAAIQRESDRLDGLTP